MFLLVANLVLEATALGATWSLRLRTLRMFLLYLIAFDLTAIPMSKLFYTSKLYFYFYWGGRTVSLLLQILLASQLLKESRWNGKVMKNIWIAMFFTVFASVAACTWFQKPITTERMQTFTIIAEAVCAALLVVAAALSTCHRTVWIGSALWVTVTLILSWDVHWYYAWYPLASLLPLLVWSSYYFVRSKQYVAATDNDSRGKASSCRSRLSDIQENVRGPRNTLTAYRG